MRVERERLKDHRDAAALDRGAGDVPRRRSGSSRCPAGPARRRRASVVVLPTALGPNSTKNRPSATSKGRGRQERARRRRTFANVPTETTATSFPLQPSCTLTLLSWAPRRLAMRGVSWACADPCRAAPMRRSCAERSTASVTRSVASASRNVGARAPFRRKALRGSRRPGGRRCARSRSAGPAPTSASM